MGMTPALTSCWFLGSGSQSGQAVLAKAPTVTFKRKVFKAFLGFYRTFLVISVVKYFPVFLPVCFALISLLLPVLILLLWVRLIRFFRASAG